MRRSWRELAKAATIAVAALAVAACGDDGGESANQAGANAIDANAMLTDPGNDASAMESVANATEPAPVANAAEPGNDAGGVLGETSGGDTGGNTVESNVSAM
jgi:hypothetical protein